MRSGTLQAAPNMTHNEASLVAIDIVVAIVNAEFADPESKL